ncbi:hypothetical protein ABEB36_004101 [Hypothenemus hampei]|uniref:SANT domain-containing protein n=1 Tax=Hypothenemus hampei TaxID=57062 RepID=A0ABD1F275_HYPHA
MSVQRQQLQITMDVDEPGEENLRKTSESIPIQVMEEPLLGSITTNSCIKEEKGVQIRSSARVFKKMKLEQEQEKKCEEVNQLEASLMSPNADHAMPTVGSTEKSSENDGKSQPTKNNTRTIRKDSKPKRDELRGEVKKEARKWTYNDKLIFFEAVNEFGKDFEAIQQYINAKLKKKGVSEDHLKSKDHVRQFFIRTFHEVSKYVKFSENVKKVVQELYSVINYGEVFKKLEVITEKALMKLVELIYTGAMCIRVKGKNVRIKTPMCRALVKLNQLDHEYEEVKLPNRVMIDLRPKDMSSYVKIQCLAQNPRLRTMLPIQKRLSALIQCLNKRWKSVDALNYEKAVESNNPMTEDCVPPKQEINDKTALLIPPLRLSPPADSKIELPSININEYFSRQTICLTAYENRLGFDTYSEIKKAISKKKKCKPEVEPVCKVEIVPDSIKVEQSNTEEVEAPTTYETESEAQLANYVHEAVNTILSLSTLERQKSETNEIEEIQPKPERLKPEPPSITDEDLDNIEKIRKGWTEMTSESLTIGEIYLMYGSDAKLILEYSWDVQDKEADTEKPKSAAANFLEIWNENYSESWEIKQKNLTTSLSKLISLAKINFNQASTKNLQCTCGHVCNDKPTKGSNNLSKPRKNTHDNFSSIKEEDGNGISVNGMPQENTSIFRQPYQNPKGFPNQTPTMQQQLNSIQKLKPIFSKKKGGKFTYKPLVVERKLPLLPNNLSGHQIVRMNIVSQESPGTVDSKTDSEMAPKLEEVINDPDDDIGAITSMSVPPSPSRILKEGENDWISAEVADYSLSSLLGHLETPTKTSLPLNLNSHMGSELSNEVDAQLQSLMTETSMDFAASFADLAASVVNDKKF